MNANLKSTKYQKKIFREKKLFLGQDAVKANDTNPGFLKHMIIIAHAHI